MITSNMKTPNDYEFQILTNQISIMSAVSLLLSGLCIDKPELTQIAEKIAELMKMNADATDELLK